MTLINFDVYNLSATLPVLYSMTLIYFFVVKYSNVNISIMVRARNNAQV